MKYYSNFMLSLLLTTPVLSMGLYPYKKILVPKIYFGTKTKLAINDTHCLFANKNTAILCDIKTDKSFTYTIKDFILGVFLTSQGPFLMVREEKSGDAFTLDLLTNKKNKIHHARGDFETYRYGTNISKNNFSKVLTTTRGPKDSFNNIICDRNNKVTGIINGIAEALNFSSDDTKLLRGNWDKKKQHSRVTIYDTKGSIILSVLMGLWNTKSVFFHPTETMICNGYYLYDTKSNKHYGMTGEKESQAIDFTSDGKYYLRENKERGELSHHLFDGPHRPVFFKIPNKKSGTGKIIRKNQETVVFLKNTRTNTSYAVHLFKNLDTKK